MKSILKIPRSPIVYRRTLTEPLPGAPQIPGGLKERSDCAAWTDLGSEAGSEFDSLGGAGKEKSFICEPSEPASFMFLPNCT